MVLIGDIGSGSVSQLGETECKLNDKVRYRLNFQGVNLNSDAELLNIRLPVVSCENILLTK